MASVVAYVDGFNLYHGLHDRYGRRMLWLDLEQLVYLLRPADDLVGIRYFSAMVRNDPHAEARQNTYLDALTATTRVPLHIILGRFQPKMMTCRACGAKWMTYEEKETDINIATRLIADAAAGEADVALVISADSDLCSAIKAARRVAHTAGHHLEIVVAFPPRRFSFEIASIARTFNIGGTKVRRAQLPLTVEDSASGQKYLRPTYWN